MEGFSLSDGEKTLYLKDFLEADYIWFYLDKVSQQQLVTPTENSDLEAFAQREWQTSLRSLFLYLEKLTGTQKWINPPSLLYVNNDKLYVTLLAINQGLQVPQFTISNHWQKNFTQKTVTKPVHPNRVINLEKEEFFNNLSLNPEELNQFVEMKQKAPCFTQELLERKKEYRVYYLLGQLVVLEMTTEDEEFNLNKVKRENIEMKPRSDFADKNPAEAQKLYNLCEEVGLNYCCFDLLETESSMWLIDINPNGSWYQHDPRGFVSQSFLEIMGKDEE